MSNLFKSTRWSTLREGFLDEPADTNEMDGGSLLSENDSANEDDSGVNLSDSGTAFTGKTGGEGNGDVDASEKSLGLKGAGSIIWKTLLVLLLSLIGFAAGFAYIFGLLSRDEKVTEKYWEYADHIAKQSLAQARQIHSQMSPINFHWTSHAMNSNNDSWPMVSLTDYHSLAISFEKGETEMIAIAPIVSKAYQEPWEDYSVENQELTWPVAEGEGRHDSPANHVLGRRGRLLHSEEEDANSTIPTRIYTRDLDYDTEHKKEYRREEKGPGPFAPLWQMYPEPDFSSEDRDLSPINYNVLSHPSIARAAQAVQEYQDAILTEPFHLFELFGIHWTYSSLQKEGGNESMSGLREPHSVIVSPIYKDFSTDEQQRELVAISLNVVPWKAFFKDLLPEGENGIVLVLKSQHSGCGETFTFQVNGRECTFLGYGDLHDDDHNYFDSVSVFSPFMNLQDNNDNVMSSYDTTGGEDEDTVCTYTLHVYPSNQFYQTYQSNVPRIFAAAMVGIFLFVCAILQLYNVFAARQERRIQLVVKKSNLIVEKFFPSEVKNRLLQEGNIGHNDDAANRGSMPGLLPKKNGTLLSESKQSQLVQLNLNRHTNAVAFEGKPIATLFPECTVMFAQIVGFTKWSVGRSPSDTFTLLETCYREFDELTKQRKVFKVETIGDCYLAVAGLPEPQKEHALIMARFSRTIMAKFTEVIQRLESTLGEETSQLKLRIGLHSGPVTAGVLRGQKTSHFQLFGDTVNTASRMQSTGLNGRIQVSVETATLLENSSSTKAKSWLTPREEKVLAKGKGKMSTMWLSTAPSSYRASSKARSSSAGSEYQGCGSTRQLESKDSFELEVPRPNFSPSSILGAAPLDIRIERNPVPKSTTPPHAQTPVMHFPAAPMASQAFLPAKPTPKFTTTSKNSSFADLMNATPKITASSRNSSIADLSEHKITTSSRNSSLADLTISSRNSSLADLANSIQKIVASSRNNSFADLTAMDTSKIKRNNSIPELSFDGIDGISV